MNNHIFKDIDSIVYATDNYQNIRDSEPEIFVVDKDLETVVKWCRKELGQRGDGWDFFVSNKKVHLTIWNKKLKFIYTMWQT